MTDIDTQAGLFPVSYRIGGDMPGAPLFTVHLTVHTPEETISGAGEITNGSIHEFDDVMTYLRGHFSTIVFGPDVNRVASLVGLSNPWTSDLVMHRNVQLNMVLSEDWQSGTASYRYRRGDSQRETVKNATVEILQPALVNA